MFRPTPRRSRKSYSRRVLPRAPSCSLSFVFRTNHCPLTTTHYPIKSFVFISFADPHPLTTIESYRYKNSGGRGSAFVRRWGRPCLIHSECPAASPLEATLASILVGVASKRLTEGPQRTKPFNCNTYKNTRWGEAFPPQRSNVPTCGRSDNLFVPLRPNAFGATIRKGTRFLYHPGKQLRSPRCLRLRERTMGTVRSWSPSQVVPRSSVLIRVSGFVLANPELSWNRSAGWLAVPHPVRMHS
jgi:hypothetical protein